MREPMKQLIRSDLKVTIIMNLVTKLYGINVYKDALFVRAIFGSLPGFRKRRQTRPTRAMNRSWSC